MNVQSTTLAGEPAMSRLFLATCVMLMAGCAAASGDRSSDENDSTSASAAFRSCGWLAGGDCIDLPRGNWRTPEFWGDHYLHKYGPQLQAAKDKLEAGPAPRP